MQTKHIIFALLFLTSTIYYYNLTDPTANLQTAQVTKIIDGDTLKTDNNQTLRLLGINTPEKNQPFYQEAKQLLTNLVANKPIQIESKGQDKYHRTLAYIFTTEPAQLDAKSYPAGNINAQILQQGLATLYYYDKDHHYKELKQAEEFARLNSLGIWKKSPNSNCIEITQFKTDEPEILTLQNSCDKILNITYKDDATHIYKATINPNSQHTKTFSHIWNTDGDSIYIYDKEGLILFHRY